MAVLLRVTQLNQKKSNVNSEEKGWDTVQSLEFITIPLMPVKFHPWWFFIPVNPHILWRN